VARDEIIEHDDVISGPAQRLRRVAADVPGAAGDENAPPVSGQWRNT